MPPLPIRIEKIAPGDNVRLRAGSVIVSDNPKTPRREVLRPYWIKVAQIDETIVRWKGSAGYFNATRVENIDSLEDYS